MNEIVDIKVPIKRFGLLIFVFGIGTIILGFNILTISISAIIKPDFQFQQEFIGYLIFFPLFLFYSMWFIFGYEKIVIRERSVELIKSNILFTRTKSIDIDDIKSIDIVKKRFTSEQWLDIKRERIREKQRAFPFWIKMGHLSMKTRKWDRTFFNGLSVEEVPDMKEKIDKEIKKRKHNNV